MRLRARLVGLVAALILLAILIGLPATLLALGVAPIPHGVPTLEQVRVAVSTPDDGTVALGAVAAIAWAAWAVLAVSILAEVTARVRGARAPRLPGLHMPQAMALQLVGAAALLFAALPSPATIAPASNAGTTTPAHTVTAPAMQQTAAGHDGDSSAVGAHHYTVRDGDTLSRIAARHLDDPQRWPEIAHLNPSVGAHPDLIYPGTVLRLPDRHGRSPAHTYTVQAGDTLSGIAERELGDAASYPVIFEASKGTTQPDGTHLRDPDQIDVGQKMAIPNSEPAPGSTEPASTAASRPAAQPGHPPGGDRADIDRATPRQTAVPEATAAASPVPAGAVHRSTRSGETTAALTPAPWMLAGLTGGGALLAGSMLILARRRRRALARNRRPGHTLASLDAVLTPVDKTLNAIGSLTAPTVEHMDQILRRLAAAAAQDATPVPQVAAVELTATHLVLHLSEPALLPEPWDGTGDGYRWKISPDTGPDDLGPDVPDQPAPYPLLVTIGLSDSGDVWLLNIEDLDVTITGDPTYGQDLARYLTAEVACNSWSAGVEITCVGVASELAGLNPDRIHVYDQGDPSSDPIAVQVAETVSTIDRSNDVGLDVATARSRQTGADPWPARLVLVDGANNDPGVDQLLDLVHTHPGCAATSVVVRGHRPQRPGTVLEVTADGRVNLPASGLNLIAVGLTSDEAQGCAALLAHSQNATTVPIPTDPGAPDGWQSWSDAAGALRAEHTLPRRAAQPLAAQSPTSAPATAEATPVTSSVLDQDDAAYLDSAATTSDDLQTLAPRVSETVRADIEDVDPTLDADLAMWFGADSALPKLRLLGPVRATTRGKPLTKRKPYMTELLTFIALRRLGATPEEVADTFAITTPKARDYVLTVRKWLGTNPRTGLAHIPDARHAPAAAVRGVPVYEVVDLLIDIDLFRRLRLRGQTRGADGIQDLRTALSLVEGRPFDYPLDREAGGGWAWLVEGDRLDEHMVAAVVDVAHLVTTHALADGDLPAARLAAETAALAAPYEEIPRLDLAAVATAEGHHAEATRIIRDQVCNRTDDDGPPPELSERTKTILGRRKDWRESKAS